MELWKQPLSKKEGFNQRE